MTAAANAMLVFILRCPLCPRRIELLLVLEFNLGVGSGAERAAEGVSRCPVANSFAFRRQAAAIPTGSARAADPARGPACSVLSGSARPRARGRRGHRLLAMARASDPPPGRRAN